MVAHEIRSPGPGAALAGLGLAATAMVPFEAGGSSPLQVIVDAFAEHWANGVVSLLVLGAPYLLGLTVAAAAVLRSTLGLVLVRVPVAILYAELVGLCLLVASQPEPLRARWSLIGFTVVATLSAIARVSGERRAGTGPNVAWLARWGAMLIAAAFGWLMLQDPPSFAEAPGLWATFVAAVVLAGSSRTRSTPAR